MARKILKRTKQYNLPIIIESCEEGGYFARCPTFPGCHVEANSIPKAIEYIEDAISAFIDSYKKHGDPLPAEILQYETTEERIPLQFFLPVRVAL